MRFLTSAMSVGMLLAMVLVVPFVAHAQDFVTLGGLASRVDSLEQAVEQDLPEFVRGEIDGLMRRYTDISNELVRLKMERPAGAGEADNGRIVQVEQRLGTVEQRLAAFVTPEPSQPPLVRTLVSVGVVALAGILLGLIGAP